MRYIVHDLKTMKKNRIVHITVWDCFTGEVKILKNYVYKWLVEIVDVSMCYPQLVPCKSGEIMWIYRKDLYRDPPTKKIKRGNDDEDEAVPW